MKQTALAIRFLRRLARIVPSGIKLPYRDNQDARQAILEDWINDYQDLNQPHRKLTYLIYRIKDVIVFRKDVCSDLLKEQHASVRNNQISPRQDPNVKGIAHQG